jgi:hypothetical protein
MKAIKLVLTFVIILGGVLGAFYLFTNTDGGTLPPPPDTTYQTYREQFERDWEQAGDWDEQLFISHYDLVQQLSTQYETATLNDLNTKTATEVVYKKIFDEWNSPSCAKNTVEKYNNAIKMSFHNGIILLSFEGKNSEICVFLQIFHQIYAIFDSKNATNVEISPL